MSTILQVVICSLIGGVFSLIGGLILIANKKRATLAEYATAFAAGALLASAFIDILPEAIEQGTDPATPAFFCLLGVIIFFLLETFVSWFHHNHKDSEHTATDPIVPMAIIGDVLHKIVDGLAIGAGFLISPASGIVVTLAVAAHEIPHEVGDFGLMFHHGVSRKNVILINILCSLVTTFSAVFFYLLGDATDISLVPILGLTAGFFIYISVSDIIPSIHSSKSKKVRLGKTITLLSGLTIVSLAIFILHDFAHVNHEDHHDHSHEQAECEHDHDLHDH